MMHDWWWTGMMRGPGLFVGLLMLLLVMAAIILGIWLIVRLVRSTSSKSAPSSGASQPQIAQLDPVMETLRRRLAEGAITIQEFDELKQKLGV